MMKQWEMFFRRQVYCRMCGTFLGAKPFWQRLKIDTHYCADQDACFYRDLARKAQMN